jgi:hypothetical protein
MWLVVAAAIGSGIYIGYLASKANTKDQQTGLWILCGASLAIGALVWCLIPRSETLGSATATYWTEMTKISHEADEFGKHFEPVTTENVEAGVLKLEHFFDDLAGEISQLSIRSVDPDAVAYSADTVQALRESKLIFEDMYTLSNRAGSLRLGATAASMFFESFVRGALGDPLGTYHEFKASSQQIGGEWDSIRARCERVQQTFAALDAREIKLRAALSERYHRDFPPLSSSHTRAK